MDLSGRLHLIREPGPDKRRAFADDLHQGLGSTPKRLSCRYFYDAAGSALFGEICRLPEYYLWRAEHEILERHAGEIAALAPAGASLVELGSGDASKTRLLLAAMARASRGKPLSYAAIDIEEQVLEESARGLLADWPGLTVTAIAAEYRAGLPHLASVPGPRLFAWLGSNIGNLGREEAAAFLASVLAAGQPGDALLLGVDLRKDTGALVAAYDDARGVTARFNLNLLVRARAELGAEVDLSGFRHRAVYEEGPGRVRMFLDSLRAQAVTLEGRRYTLTEGEAIHTEDCYKYSLEELDALARRLGRAVRFRRTDTLGRFASVLLA